MSHRCRLVPAVVALLALATAARLRAESLPDREPRYFQIRTTDRRITEAVERGLRGSATFRELVDRINASDVVVYVTGERAALPPGLDGRLTFVSSTGGYRYVVVRVNANLSTARLVALLGHELQHAREIADTDAIIDAPSMARAYASRLGYHNRAFIDDRWTFDSAAAVRAGEDVLKEMLGE